MSSESTEYPLSDDEPIIFIEPNTHSFMLKLWLDDKAKETNGAIWRGHLTHIASSERRHFDSLHDVVALIAPYLEQMGVKLSIFWRVYLWLTR